MTVLSCVADPAVAIALSWRQARYPPRREYPFFCFAKKNKREGATRVVTPRCTMSLHRQPLKREYRQARCISIGWPSYPFLQTLPSWRYTNRNSREKAASTAIATATVVSRHVILIAAGMESKILQCNTPSVLPLVTKHGRRPAFFEWPCVTQPHAAIGKNR